MTQGTRVASKSWKNKRMGSPLEALEGRSPADTLTSVRLCQTFSYNSPGVQRNQCVLF